MSSVFRPYAYSFRTPVKNIKYFFCDLKCCHDRIHKGIAKRMHGISMLGF